LLPNVANTMVWFPHVFWQWYRIQTLINLVSILLKRLKVWVNTCFYVCPLNCFYTNQFFLFWNKILCGKMNFQLVVYVALNFWIAVFFGNTLSSIIPACCSPLELLLWLFNTSEKIRTWTWVSGTVGTYQNQLLICMKTTWMRICFPCFDILRHVF
jgi:hypothetical protein